MRASVAILLLWYSFVGVAIGNSDASTGGVQKVIEMLTKMETTCKQEKMDEQVAFEKFTTWCEQKAPFMKDEIAKNAGDIEMLTAKIGTLADDISTLGEDLSTLNGDVASAVASQKQNEAERKKAHEAFLAEEQDYQESVDAVASALAVLQKQDFDRTGAAASLLQIVDGKQKIPDRVKSIVAAFVGMLDNDKQTTAAPEANAYEFQSGGIIQILKNLQDEFRGKLAQCQKEEMNAQAAHDMVMLELKDTQENAEQDIETKTKTKASKQESKALNNKQLGETTELKAENEKTLATMDIECKEKKFSFAEKQDLRTQEIEAIAKAIEILKSKDVTGNAEKHLDLAQQKQKTQHTSLIFLEKSATVVTLRGIERKLRQFLSSEAKRLNNQQLALLAQKVGAVSAEEGAADPFAKVKGMIDAMITRLLKEQEADAEHEGFCDKEMGKNKVTRTRLSEEIDTLTAACDEGKSTILSLSDDIASLGKKVSELVSAMDEATAMRKDEKAKNTQTIEDAKAAQGAVDAATKVLKDFYEKAGSATALLQVGVTDRANPKAFGLDTGVKMGSEEWNALATPAFDGELQKSVDTGHKEGMRTFGESYSGMQDSANGVLAMLEVILSDFATLQADTEDAEAVSQKAYENFMTQSKRDKATSEKSSEMKSSDKVEAERKLTEDTADLKNTQDELIAADKYYEKLVPQCNDQGMSFDERQKARQSEITSLKEALKILSSPDMNTSA